MRFGESFCPGILNAVAAKDGLLMRIRFPGGLIASAQLLTIANICAERATGQLEITSRANIQIRGLTPQDLPIVVEHLADAGLLPSPEHDRVRNIVASPLAGLDPEELCDPRELVRSLDAQLRAEPAFAKLPSKFSMALDGGGRWFSDETDDLQLRAVRLAECDAWHLSVGDTSTGLLVSTDRAVDFLLQAAKVCLNAAERFGVATRARTLLKAPSAMARVLEELARSTLPFHVSALMNDSERPISDPPVGIGPGAHDGKVNIVPSLPLGRLTSAQARAVADLSTRLQLDLRLAPWRGIVLGSVPKTASCEVLEALASMKLPIDVADGFVGLSACAGVAGCDAALADVRAHAVVVAHVLAGRVRQPHWRVTFAGCDKQCAMRTPATVKLVAEQDGYSMRYQGATLLSGLSAEHVTAAVTSLASGTRAGVHP